MIPRLHLLRKRTSSVSSWHQISSQGHGFFNYSMASERLSLPTFQSAKSITTISACHQKMPMAKMHHQSPFPNPISQTPTSTTNIQSHLYQQTRNFAGRKDRQSTAFEIRPPTKKQRKAYHRRRRQQEFEANKHSKPMSKAGPRRRVEKETTERLIDIAREEERLKGELGIYFSKVREYQEKIESSDTFRSLEKGLVKDGMSVSARKEAEKNAKEIKNAAREAAKQAAEKDGITHPPLPSWHQDALKYDWGDALVDDLIGNSADLTSSASPFPIFMGKEYGKLRRKVERIMRGKQEKERLALLDREDEVKRQQLKLTSNSQQQQQHQNNQSNDSSNASPLASFTGDISSSLAITNEDDATTQTKHLPSTKSASYLSDKLISDLIRAHRDHRGKRTKPIGLAKSLQLLFQDLQIPRLELGTYSYTSLLTCCKSPREARMVNEMRKEDGVRSNEYFWSALVDVYARSGDYRGAEKVLDEMLEETKLEYEQWKMMNKRMKNGEGTVRKEDAPIAIPPLPAYTSFFSACYKLVSRPDVHPSIKSDASKRAWNRWKEMRIHSVPPDAMAYGALMRMFAAQGRAEKALDLVEEVMAQMMLPVNAEGVLTPNGMGGMRDEALRSFEGDGNGWYDDRDGNTVRVKPTTLLFTSALKAVARSHEIANRYSGGKSKKNRRRERITAYHGKLARKIVILAEQAEVEQDDGFVSALMLCAASAGDSSTARAIYLGSKVRRMDHLRTCGGKEHLKKLQGLIPEEDRDMLDAGISNKAVTAQNDGSSNVPSLLTIEEEFADQHKAYENREYGTDTRVLSTLLMAHARAMEPQGLGTMWAGHFNKGYLCENSLRYIEAYNRPQYENKAIPGITTLEAGLTPEGWEAEDFDDDNSKRLRKPKKFNVKSITDDGEGNTMDDLDPLLEGLDSDESDNEKSDLLRLSGGYGEDAHRDWLDNQITAEEDSQELLANDGVTTLSFEREQSPAHDSSSVDSDSVTMNKDDLVSKLAQLSHDPELGNEGSDNDDEDGNYEEEFEKFMQETKRGHSEFADSDGAEKVDSIPGIATNDFAAFSSHVKKEMGEDMGSEFFDEQEIRELFDMMRANYQSNDSSINANDLSDPLSNNDVDDDEMNSFVKENDIEQLMKEQSREFSEDVDESSDEFYNMPGVAANDFERFKSHLRQELKEEGASHDIDESEAKDLFDMMRAFYEEDVSDAGTISDAEFNEGEPDGTSEKIRKNVEAEKLHGSSEANGLGVDGFFQETSNSYKQSNDSFSKNVLSHAETSEITDWKTPQMKSNLDATHDAVSNRTMYADDFLQWSDETNSSSEDERASVGIKEVDPPPVDMTFQKSWVEPVEPEDPHLSELQQVLPGLPKRRIEKISEEFSKVLGYPSILKLALVLRENMPDYLGGAWLRKKNLANAKHLMSLAEKDGLVDVHLLNGMLQVQANSGRIDPAIRYHDTEFKKHDIAPTTHSDRLLFQMLVKHKRISRALKLKESVENEGRVLDLLSYGSLVEHFGNHNQIGSALLLIKECIAVHGSPPGEKSLKNIRLTCRMKGLTDQIGLEKLVGKDPLEWLHQGKKLQKTKSSKKSRINVNIVTNRMLDI